MHRLKGSKTCQSSTSCLYNTLTMRQLSKTRCNKHPKQERKRLDKLVRTKAIDDIRNAILSKSNCRIQSKAIPKTEIISKHSSKLNHLENSSVILEFVDVVEKEALKRRNYRSHCSCYSCSALQARNYLSKPRRHKRLYGPHYVGKYSISGSSTISQYRVKESRFKDLCFNAKSIKSDPCTCTSEISEMLKREINVKFRPTCHKQSPGKKCTLKISKQVLENRIVARRKSKALATLLKDDEKETHQHTLTIRGEGTYLVNLNVLNAPQWSCVNLKLKRNDLMRKSLSKDIVFLTPPKLNDMTKSSEKLTLHNPQMSRYSNCTESEEVLIDNVSTISDYLNIKGENSKNVNEKPDYDQAHINRQKNKQNIGTSEEGAKIVKSKYRITQHSTNKNVCTPKSLKVYKTKNKFNEVQLIVPPFKEQNTMRLMKEVMMTNKNNILSHKQKCKSEVSGLVRRSSNIYLPCIASKQQLQSSSMIKCSRDITKSSSYFISSSSTSAWQNVESNICLKRNYIGTDPINSREVQNIISKKVITNDNDIIKKSYRKYHPCPVKLTYSLTGILSTTHYIKNQTDIKDNAFCSRQMLLLNSLSGDVLNFVDQEKACTNVSEKDILKTDIKKILSIAPDRGDAENLHRKVNNKNKAITTQSTGSTSIFVYKCVQQLCKNFKRNIQDVKKDQLKDAPTKSFKDITHSTRLYSSVKLTRKTSKCTNLQKLKPRYVQRKSSFCNAKLNGKENDIGHKYSKSKILNPLQRWFRLLKTKCATQETGKLEKFVCGEEKKQHSNMQNKKEFKNNLQLMCQASQKISISSLNKPLPSKKANPLYDCTFNTDRYFMKGMKLNNTNNVMSVASYNIKLNTKEIGFNPSLKTNFCSSKANVRSQHKNKNREKHIRIKEKNKSECISYVENRPTNAKFKQKIITSTMCNHNRKPRAIKKHASKSFGAFQGNNVYTVFPVLLPYECEPGICVPGECDPLECYKRIKRRQVCQSAGTDRPTLCTSGSSASGPIYKAMKCQAVTEIPIKKHRKSVTYADQNAGIFEPKTIGAMAEEGSPSIVRVGSSISFNIEFYKSSGGAVPCEPPEPCEVCAPPCKPKVKTTVCRPSRQHRKISMPKTPIRHHKLQSIETETKGTRFAKSKRSLATIALQKNEQQSRCMNVCMEESLPVCREIGICKDESLPLCKEIGVCTQRFAPCEEGIIVRRIKDFGTKPICLPHPCASNMVCIEPECRNTAVEPICAPRREIACTTIRRRPRTYFMPKRLARFGSNITLNVEFYKKRTGGIEFGVPNYVYQPGVEKKCIATDDCVTRDATVKCTPQLQSRHACIRGTAAYSQQCQAEGTASCGIGTATGMKTFVKRCFCTLNLSKKRRVCQTPICTTVGSRPSTDNKYVPTKTCELNTCDTQAEYAKTADKGSHVNNLLKRCFCTLKFFKNEAKLSKSPTKVLTVNRVYIEDAWNNVCKSTRNSLHCQSKSSNFIRNKNKKKFYGPKKGKVTKESSKANISKKQQITSTSSVNSKHISKNMETVPFISPYSPYEFRENASLMTIYCKKYSPDTQTKRSSNLIKSNYFKQNVNKKQKKQLIKRKQSKSCDKCGKCEVVTEKNTSLQKNSVIKSFMQNLSFRFHKKSKKSLLHVDIGVNTDIIRTLPVGLKKHYMNIVKSSKSDRQTNLNSTSNPKTSVSLKETKICKYKKPKDQIVPARQKHKRRNNVQYNYCRRDHSLFVESSVLECKRQCNEFHNPINQSENKNKNTLSYRDQKLIQNNPSVTSNLLHGNAKRKSLSNAKIVIGTKTTKDEIFHDSKTFSRFQRGDEYDKNLVLNYNHKQNTYVGLKCNEPYRSQCQIKRSYGISPYAEYKMVYMAAVPEGGDKEKEEGGRGDKEGKDKGKKEKKPKEKKPKEKKPKKGKEKKDKGKKSKGVGTKEKKGKKTKTKKGGKKKKAKTCTCGSKVCYKELKKKSKEKEQKPSEPCTCGGPVCSYESDKRAIPGHVCYCDAEMAKRCRKACIEKMYKQREAACRERNLKAKRRAEQKRRQKEVIKMITKEQDKQQVEKFKQLPDSTLAAESVLDVVKSIIVGVPVSIVTGIVKSIFHPKCTYYQIRRAFRNPNEAICRMECAISESEVALAAQRIKNRTKAMETVREIKHNLENRPSTNYILNIKHPEKRTRFKRKRPLRKRVRLDFDCSLYMSSLRKKPCMFVYNNCPWCYPQCLSFLNAWRQCTDIFLFLLAVGVWSPFILAMEACRALLCCFFCTG